MIDNIDFSKIKPDPTLFTIIHFTLNISEKLYPIFVSELNRTIAVCKIMKKEGVQPISNPLFLNNLMQIFQ